MQEFQTSLIREKLVFDADTLGIAGPMDTEIIRSNRISFAVGGEQGERIAIRAQNLPGTLRFASRIYDNYFLGGPFLRRERPFNWDSNWQKSLSDYDKAYHVSDNWIAAYVNGQSVFKNLETRYMDVVEKCAFVTEGQGRTYEETPAYIEHALATSGKPMQISHEVNVATTFKDDGETMRCGIMYRADSSNSTFSFTATGSQTTARRISQSFLVAAAFLETINLSMFIADVNRRVESGEIPSGAPEGMQARAAQDRKAELLTQIDNFENTFTVKYRPERPDFQIRA